ncbi:MAG: SulP family inorganic anion transporter [Pelagibacteraceae bacterium TMED124]|nr:hypothetical protein [Candidatus Neomarinimicrobiota bacterium]RPG19100.1 MAG: SulP family inorganic anion transporter [Pelagibacteraceae bacterium TMED124]|tara:strand:+ start:2174 stop:3862 length:1689 start_codon:yes stop_codon:yes gene_type:complete
MNKILTFIFSRFKEVSPYHNLKILHKNIKADVLAGITVAIIALPMALAFGEMSQLGPIAGVWGAIAGGIVGGFFGGCVVGVSGPTAPKAAQIAVFVSIISSSSNDPYLAAFSIIFLSGIILIIISMLNISRFIHFIPYSVIAGFMCGIGLIVIITQINAFVGLENKKTIHEVLQNLPNTFQNVNIEALFVAVPSLLILFLWPYIENKINFVKTIPSPLICLFIGSMIAYFMDLKIPYIGDQMGKSDSVEVFSFYFPDFSQLSQYIGPAFALAGLAVLDSLLSCKVADNITGKRHSSDRETFGQGMANIVAGLFGGVTTATATMRTVANIKFGAKTPLASIVHGFTLLGILLGLGFLVAAIPNACLAAILFKVGIDILDYRIIPIFRKIPKTDLLVFIIVLFVTVYADLMIAVGIGVIVSIVRNLNEIKRALSSKYSYKVISLLNSNLCLNDNKKEMYSKIALLQPVGPIFFGSVEPMIDSYNSYQSHNTLIVDMSKVTVMDLTGAFAMEDLFKNLKLKKIKFFILNADSGIMDKFKDIVSVNTIGSKYFKDSMDDILNCLKD